jgi:hypothetical protein
MYRSAKTPSQLLGDLNRFHRHFREIDWDDDVLNVQRFHAHSMKCLQLVGSAFLAKDRAFFGASGLFAYDALAMTAANSSRRIGDHRPSRCP